MKQGGLKHQAQTLLLLLAENPFQAPPAYEKLVGNLKVLFQTDQHSATPDLRRLQ
ncbi:MAG: hypothetical protein R2860_08130 [Desulfobacterales bacterium]